MKLDFKIFNIEFIERLKARKVIRKIFQKYRMGGHKLKEKAKFQNHIF